MANKISVECPFHPSCLTTNGCSFICEQLGAGKNVCLTHGIIKATPTKPVVEVWEVIEDLIDVMDKYKHVDDLLTKYKQILDSAKERSDNE